MTMNVREKLVELLSRFYGYVSTDSVTHWMPLPEPPKGE